MNSARKWAAAVLAALVVAAPALVVIAQSSSAGTSTPTTVQATSTRVVAGRAVKLRGTTSRARRYVVLQRRDDGRWRRVAGVWSDDGRFRFAPRVRAGRNTFRAVSTRRTLSNGTVLRKTVSNQVTVRSDKAAATTTASPTVEAASLTRGRLNAHREHLGYEGMSASSCLSQFAAAHSQRMVNHDVFDHSSASYFTSRGYPSYSAICPRMPQSWRGEVITKVPAADPQEAAVDAFESWMSSRPHREIIENHAGRNYWVGVGFARSDDGSWWATAVIAYGS